MKWAQRSDKIYLTIELLDAKDVKLKLEPEGKLSFSATREGVPYEFDIDLFDKVNIEESKFSIGARSIPYTVKKAEKKWWSRLLKEEGKPPSFITVDWDKWIDEDDENESTGLDNKMNLTKKQKRKSRKKNLLQQMMKKLKLGCVCKF